MCSASAGQRPTRNAPTAPHRDGPESPAHGFCSPHAAIPAAIAAVRLATPANQEARPRVPVHGCLRAFLQRVGPGFIDLVQDEAGDDWLDERSETVLRATVPSQSSTNTARSNMAGYR